VLAVRKKRTVAALVSVVAAVGLGLGALSAPDRGDAEKVRRASYENALSKAEASAYGRHYKQGRRTGIERGKAQATAPGPGVVASSAPSKCPPGQYNYAGRGCVPTDCPSGPTAACAHPPTPEARPEDCPSGEVPVGETGACAPAESEDSSGGYTDQLPNGKPGYTLPENERSIACVGIDAETGECVGD
jgi:hypothetical protein